MAISAEGPIRIRGKGRPKNSETAAASLAEILNLLRNEVAQTRQELERASQYGRAVVADRLATLSNLSLIDDTETGTATGGRAPRLVRFNKDRARLIAVALQQSAIGIGLADISGRLLTEHHESADLNASAADTVARIVTLARWLLSRQPESRDLWGISVSAPGPVVTDPGQPFLAATPDFLPGWANSNLVEDLCSAFRTPVWLSSSLKTMTMGEHHGGVGQGHDTMLFVRIGTRIGAGLVSGGKPYHGSAGAVGLIGQLPAHHDAESGTLNYMAGAEMFRRQGLAAAESGQSRQLADILRRTGEVTENDVCQAAQMGDPTATEIVTRSGRLVGGVVATLANMLNPDLIVLAGTVAQSTDILLAAVREAVYGASHPLVTRDLTIVTSRMSGSAGLLGAASVAVEALFAPDTLKEWIYAGTPVKHPKLVEILGEIDRRAEPQSQGDNPPPVEN